MTLPNDEGLLWLTHSGEGDEQQPEEEEDELAAKSCPNCRNVTTVAKI